MRKILIRPSWLVVVLVFLAVLIFAFNYPSTVSVFEEARQKGLDTPEEITVDLSEFSNAEENQQCFQCHGQSKYTYLNPELDRMVNQRMYNELIISPNTFYTSVHKRFSCTDCHSYDYTTFPHPGNLRMEYAYTCLDCHGEDELSAPYHFLSIDEEFQESVHSEKLSDDFTCWMCHDPHSYQLTARSDATVTETIIYNNTICLDCHSDFRRYQVLTERERPNLMETHKWLPNQELHLTSVRCIECHTARTNDSLMVTHKILPKDLAVKNCKECHSSNPTLLASLYQWEASEVRSEKGFFRGIFNSDSTVIGANRNYLLNIISLIIFGGVIAGVLFHTILRILKK